MYSYGLILLVCAFFIKHNEGNKFNVSYTELQFCKEYDVNSGYKYTDFFYIKSFKPNHNIDYDDTIVNLRLFVLASKDAHILLSPTDQIKSSAIYEIVLGAGSNTFNEIRRQRQSQPLKTMRKKNFLSSTDIMPLTVRITKSGNISVAITGNPPFMTAFDPNVLDIKYISFSTWASAEGKWFYDCETDNSTEDKLIAIKQNLTDYQRLENDLLNDYEPNNPPHGLETIFLDFNLVHTNFNSKKSFMTSRARFQANWIDSKMIWNASTYGGESKLRFYNIQFPRAIWTPQLRLLNGKDNYYIGYLPLTYTIIIFSNGSVWAESNENTFSTWCLNTNRNWPYEHVTCNIQIQLGHLTNATLMPMNNTFIIVPKNPNYDSNEGEWHIEETKAMATLHQLTDAPYFMSVLGFNNSAYIFKINVTLRRNSLFYNQLIAVPLIGAFLLVLLSFWVDRFLRIMLNAFSLLVLIVMLLVLFDHGPNNYTPTVVIYYTCSLFVTCISLFSFTIHCWFKEQKPNIKILNQIASSTWVQFWCGINLVDKNDYDVDYANDTCKVIDRLLFVICVLIFIICSSIGY